MTNKELITFYKCTVKNHWNIPVEYLTEYNIKVFIKTLLEKIKKCKTNKDILRIYNNPLLIHNGLKYLFNIYDNTYDIIQIVYPDRFKIWELQDAISNKQIFWTEDNIIKCLKWIMEEKLQYTTEEINKYEAYRIKIDLLLNHYIKTNVSLPYLLEKAYPNRFKIWLFGRIPKGYWENKNNIIKAVKWLAEEKYNIFEDSSRKLSINIFRLYGLYALIKKYTIYELIELAYPGEFKPWEVCRVPKGYWNRETSIEAFKWLIEEKLELSPNEIEKSLNKDIIYEYRLQTPFIITFGKSRKRIKEILYPEEV